MTTTAGDEKLGEPNGHVMMRHARMFFGLCLVVSLIATIVLFIFNRQAAYIAALPVPPLFLALIVVSYLEKKSRVKKIRVRHQATISPEEVEMNVQYAGIYTAIGLIMLFATATFIVAATMFDDWAKVGLAATVLFMLVVLIILPYIPLFIENAAQDERDKLGREALKAEGDDRNGHDPTS
ncbi:hypothetical protein SH449x_005088 [Pirellulaceae bacterium SH449]